MKENNYIPHIDTAALLTMGKGIVSLRATGGSQ